MGRQLTDSFVQDTGPAAVQALGAEAVIGGLSITIGIGLGSRTLVTWQCVVDNDAAAVAETEVGPAIDGVRIANSLQVKDLPAVAGYRSIFSGAVIITGTAAAQIVTLRAEDLAGNTSVQAEEARLQAHILTQLVGAESVLSSP